MMSGGHVDKLAGMAMIVSFVCLFILQQLVIFLYVLLS